MAIELKIGDGFENYRTWAKIDEVQSSDDSEFMPNYIKSLGNGQLSIASNSPINTRFNHEEDSLFPTNSKVYSSNPANNGSDTFVGTSLGVRSQSTDLGMRYALQKDLGGNNFEMSYATSSVSNINFGDLDMLPSSAAAVPNAVKAPDIIIVLDDGLGNEWWYGFGLMFNEWKACKRQSAPNTKFALALAGDRTAQWRTGWNKHFFRAWESGGSIKFRFTDTTGKIAYYQEALPAGYSLTSVYFMRPPHAGLGPENQYDDLNIWEGDAAQEAIWDGNFASQTFDFQPHIKQHVLLGNVGGATENVEQTTNGDADDWAFSSVDAFSDMTDGDNNTYGIPTLNQRGLLQNKSFDDIASELGHNISEITNLAFKGSEISDDDGQTMRTTLGRDGGAQETVDVASQISSERGAVCGFIGKGSSKHTNIAPVPGDDNMLATIKLLP